MAVRQDFHAVAAAADQRVEDDGRVQRPGRLGCGKPPGGSECDAGDEGQDRDQPG